MSREQKPCQANSGIIELAAYRYVNALSFDVVLGAVISSIFFAKLLEVTLPPIILATLALAVWTIYTMDHLWDAYRSQNPERTFRHQLHQNNFRVLSVLVVLSIVFGVVLLWHLPTITRVWGIGLTLVIVVYFIIMRFLQKQIYHKEILVALVYTCGVLVGPYSLYQGALSVPHILVIIQFAALAFSNLLVFAYFEFEFDHYQNFGSLPRSIGKPRTRSLVVGLLILVLLTTSACWLTCFEQDLIRNSQWIIMLMAVSLAATIKWPEFFRTGDRYRFLGDGIFFIPILVL